MSIDDEQDDHVVTITINRPEAHNSLDMEHFRGLLGAWTRFRDDESAWVAVVTGTGKAFCTGADLKSFIPELTGTLDRPDGWDRMDALHAVLHRQRGPLHGPRVRHLGREGRAAGVRREASPGLAGPLTPGTTGVPQSGVFGQCCRDRFYGWSRVVLVHGRSSRFSSPPGGRRGRPGARPRRTSGGCR
jgi:hypothetical protein